MIITIARQCGCGALHIGEQLSQHYGIPFYTRKNLLELAQKRSVLQEMDDFFEERPSTNSCLPFHNSMKSRRT